MFLPKHLGISGRELRNQAPKAPRELPNFPFKASSRKYIKEYRLYNIFLGDEDGNRIIWGVPLDYQDLKDWRCSRYQELHADDASIRYMIPKPGLDMWKEINQPKPLAIRSLVEHPSETGWNLPQEDPRHFLKFPQEIINQIFSFALAVPEFFGLKPLTVTANCKENWQASDFYLSKAHNHKGDFGYYQTLHGIRLEDDKGPYAKCHYVNRKPIDASLLRTNKQFYMWGINILYSQSFLFEMVRYRPQDQGISLINGKMHDPYTGLLSDPNTTINEIAKRVPLERLSGYNYYSPFARFLHTIGTENAARLKILKFEGIVELHNPLAHYLKFPSSENTRWRLSPVLMALYIPLIVEFCPLLERLVIIVFEDNICQNDPGCIKWETRDQALLRVLQEVRKIPSLKVLEVFDDSDHTNTLPVADETVQWLNDRSAERERRLRQDKWEDERVQKQLGETKVKCDFCGEGHVWAECYNLCNFCGEYGHKRQECLRAALSTVLGKEDAAKNEGTKEPSERPQKSHRLVTHDFHGIAPRSRFRK